MTEQLAYLDEQALLQNLVMVMLAFPLIVLTLLYLYKEIVLSAGKK